MADGGNLAILNMKELNEFALNKFDPYRGPFWIGATDQEVENEWKWIDGSKVELTNWHTGEPNRGTSENCLSIIMDRWHDASCLSSYFYICERKHTTNRACTIVP